MRYLSISEIFELHDRIISSSEGRLSWHSRYKPPENGRQPTAPDIPSKKPSPSKKKKRLNNCELF
jgi:hypothetical protein